MDRLDIERLRSLSSEGAAKRLGIDVKQHKALCPFHDDHTPSLTFKRNKWKCWSCGEDGDTISLVEKILHKDFLDACRWLADENNIILAGYKPEEEKPAKPFDASRYARFFEHPWLSDEACRFLYEERHIDPRVVRWCRLTSWRDKQGTPWLQIPYYNREGKLIGIQNRNLGGGSPRFRFPQGAECSIYNLPVLNRLRAGEDLYITEGCSDCWAMLSSGHKAIAIPSATLLKPKDVNLLSTLHSQLSTRFHMYPDNDVPGERLFLQLQQRLPNLQHHHLPPGCKDYGEMYAKF